MTAKPASDADRIEAAAPQIKVVTDHLESARLSHRRSHAAVSQLEWCDPPARIAAEAPLPIPY